MKIGPKLTISFDCIMVLMAITAGLFFWSQKQLLHNGKKISAAYAKAMALKDISRSAVRQVNEVRDIAASGSVRGQRRFLAYSEEILYQFGRLENMMRSDTSSSPKSAEKSRAEDKIQEIAGLKRQYTETLEYCSAILKTAKQGDNSRSIKNPAELIATEFDRKFVSPLEKMIMLEEYEISVVKQNTLRKEAFMRMISWAIVALTVITTIFLSVFVSRTISKPIAKLREAAKKIGDGDLQIRIDTGSNDEVGELAVALKTVSENLELTIDNLSRELEWHGQMEEEYKHLAGELERADRELREFTNVLSYDLKVPLRGVKALVKWFSTDYANKVDTDGEKQLRLLASRVDRMHNLIDGILQYMRIGRIEEEESLADLNEIAANAVRTVAKPSNMTVTIENKLPAIICEPTRIAQLFKNLISNAVKLMDKPEGWIKIRCEDKNDLWEFSVSDNGRGIEEKDFETIFKIFQSLPGRDNSENAGVELALSKKIVELYGGRIWVQSKVGEGSTFYFTLPKRRTRVSNGMTLMTSR